MVQLPTELIERLDHRATRDRVSRSGVIRDAVVAYLHDDVEEDLARRYQDAYERVPVDMPDAWGDVELFHAELEARRRPVSP